MVKVTIEHDGKIHEHSGDMFVGQVSKFDGSETAMTVMLIGSGNPEQVAKSLERMTVSTLQGLSNNPIIVCGSLIEVQEGIDKAIREYLEGNIDELVKNFREAVVGEEAVE